MAKLGPGQPPDTVPTKFPDTTPQQGPDLSAWLLTAINGMTATLGRIDATVERLQDQLTHLESKVDGISTEVRGQAKWVHTVKVILGALGAVVGAVVVAMAVTWVKSKMSGGPPAP